MIATGIGLDIYVFFELVVGSEETKFFWLFKLSFALHLANIEGRPV